MSILIRAVLPIALALMTNFAAAGGRSGFTQAGFEAAQQADKPILVEIIASWCPTCKAQAPILNELRGDPKFKELEVFSVDFDNQKEIVQSFKVNKQSTLIVFKGSQEVGRSTGDTRKDSIEALLARSL
jgi:thioredoxin 1